MTCKLTIELPTATEKFLNEIIERNRWLGNAENILWYAIREKLIELHALNKR